MHSHLVIPKFCLTRAGISVFHIFPSFNPHILNVCNVHPNDFSRMIPRMCTSVLPLVLMCLIPTNIGLATWHPPFDVNRPPFVHHRPPVCTLFVHRSTGTCRTTSYSSAVLNLVSVVDLDPIHSQLQLTFQKIHKWTFLATLVALHFTPVSERVSDS